MGSDPERSIDLDTEQFEARAQWVLTESGPFDARVHIQVGTLASGGWYVRHPGFGTHGFEDKQAAWDAVRGLMALHRGRWERTDPDPRPFAVARQPDGARVLYDNEDANSLHGCWGEQKDQRWWGQYSAALDAGTVLRRTQVHPLIQGEITLVEYQEPQAGATRYALSVSHDSAYYVVDYPDRDQADAAYEKQVRDHADDQFPYLSTDIAEIRVDRRSRPPDDLGITGDGAIAAADDVDEYNYLYSLTPRGRWPVTAEMTTPPGPVCAMTAEPRDWGPVEVRVTELTSGSWGEQDEELDLSDVSLIGLPDGRQLLATAHDSAAHVWSVRDGTRVQTVAGHSEPVLSVALTTRGDGSVVLATGGQDGLARAWAARDGDALQEIQAHSGPVNAVAWACPPGHIPWLITGGDDAHVRAWDVEFKRPRAEFSVGEPGVHIVGSVAATVLSSGEVCVVAGSAGDAGPTVHVWNATTRTLLWEAVVEPGDSMPRVPGVAVAVLADRSYRVAAVGESVLQVWDGHTGDEIRTLPVPQVYSGDVAVAALPDLRVVVAAATDERTLVWELESGVQLATVDHNSRGVWNAVDLAVRPDGGVLMATGRRGVPGARVFRLDLRW
jgi:WD40 repeat protein